MSAKRCCFFALCPERRHARRKASPIFLFGLPKNSLMHECTTPAMRLTKTMTWSCNTSVASVKFRMSQNPKIASTRRPGIIAFNAELSPPWRFCPMISAPASPKPRANNEPILMIVFSSTTVSMGSGTCFEEELLPRRFACLTHFRTIARYRFSTMTPCRSTAETSLSSDFNVLRCFLMPCSLCCSLCRSSSPMAIASRGFRLMRLSFVIILSIGVSTKVFASREKVIAPKPSKKQMNKVWNVFNMASMREPRRRSNTNRKLIWSHSCGVNCVGNTTDRS
mmetsp:Transcript_42542/g.123665  ORF Transcript_42542/g.123665 Transcript_42542/m.123665 type:complete len:280 (+) Transcript_42542:804-1643(+)